MSAALTFIVIAIAIVAIALAIIKKFWEAVVIILLFSAVFYAIKETKDRSLQKDFIWAMKGHDDKYRQKYNIQNIDISHSKFSSSNFYFTADIINNSNSKISNIVIEIIARDCHQEVCQDIATVNIEPETDIPPRLKRSVEKEFSISGFPAINGELRWFLNILAINGKPD